MSKTKTTTKKKVTAKKAASKKVTANKTTGNKVLDGILGTIAKAKKDGLKSVVVFTTNDSHYKANDLGFGSSDLKPKLLEAYKHIFCKYDVITKLVDPSTKAVEWVVRFK